MDEQRKLTKDEATKLSRGLHPGANYLIRLRTRMSAAGFIPDDPIFKLVIKAQDIMQQLCMAVHYAGCERGIGEPSAGK